MRKEMKVDSCLAEKKIRLMMMKEATGTVLMVMT